MAVIGKIRQRSGLIIGIIALSLLAFILSDALTKNQFFRSNDRTVGKMNGSKIDYVEFEAEVTKLEENYKKQGAQYPGLEDMIRDQVWEDYFRKKVLLKHYEKMHIRVSPEELTWVEFKAPTPHPLFEQLLRDNSTGQINKNFANDATGDIDLNKLLTYRKSLEEGSEEEDQWLLIDENIMQDLQNKKYFNYVRKGHFVTSLEAKQDFLEANNNLKGKVVRQDYINIADSTIKVTDAELEEYLQKHAGEFKQDESRKLEYVVFDIKPSEKDTATALQWAIDKTAGFQKTTNDSSYAVTLGGTYDTVYQRRGQFAPDVEDSLFTAQKGTVIGPSYKNGEYKIYKVLDAKNDTVLYYKAAHIVLRPEGITKEDTAKARQRATEILAEIRSGKKDFATAVTQYSLDPSTNNKGGDMGWFDKKAFQYPKSLVDAVVRTGKGDYTIVTSGQGVHIVKVTESPSSRMIRVATISRTIEPGGQTFKDISEKAGEFAGSVRTEEEFNQTIEKMQLSKRFAEKVNPQDKVLPGINDARRVIMWAFEEDRKAGDISAPFSEVSGGTKILVARLVAIRKEGTAKIEDVKDKLEEAVRRDKKADQLRQKMEDAMKGAASIDQVAQKLGVQIMDMSYQQFNNPNVTSIGREEKLLGYLYASAAEKNKIKGPIKGESGVFVFVIDGFDEAKVPEKLDESKQRLMMAGGAADTKINDALKKMANIKDYRYKFF